MSHMHSHGRLYALKSAGRRRELATPSSYKLQALQHTHTLGNGLRVWERRKGLAIWGWGIDDGPKPWQDAHAESAEAQGWQPAGAHASRWSVRPSPPDAAVARTRCVHSPPLIGTRLLCACSAARPRAPPRSLPGATPALPCLSSQQVPHRAHHGAPAHGTMHAHATQWHSCPSALAHPRSCPRTTCMRASLSSTARQQGGGREGAAEGAGSTLSRLSGQERGGGVLSPENAASLLIADSAAEAVAAAIPADPAACSAA
eukprot:364536-Chlamydomonas_euryale.AAC.18